jgi:uncharacterized membrane protein required for colicin V production
MNLDQLPFNVFDVVLVAMLVVGIVRGRKHGMSEELFRLLKWVAMIVACTFLYEPGGKLMAESMSLSPLLAMVTAYASVALVIHALFGLVRYRLGSKLVGSDVFGRTEYYLGMGAGMVRFGCVLVAALALLNARLYSATELRAMEKFQMEQFSKSNLFPTLHTVQESVFERSLTGPWIRSHLSFLLIKPTPASQKQYRQQEWASP